MVLLCACWVGRFGFINGPRKSIQEIVCVRFVFVFFLPKYSSWLKLLIQNRIVLYPISCCNSANRTSWNIDAPAILCHSAKCIAHVPTIWNISCGTHCCDVQVNCILCVCRTRTCFLPHYNNLLWAQSPEHQWVFRLRLQTVESSRLQTVDCDHIFILWCQFSLINYLGTVPVRAGSSNWHRPNRKHFPLTFESSYVTYYVRMNMNWDEYEVVSSISVTYFKIKSQTIPSILPAQLNYFEY